LIGPVRDIYWFMSVSRFAIFAVLLGFCLVTSAPAQSAIDRQPSLPPAVRERLSEKLRPGVISLKHGTVVSREQREDALTHFFAGQRHLWASGRMRSQAGRANSAESARQSFVKAVSVDASLAEAYTALAEISLSNPPVDIDEAVALAGLAVEVSPTNFGGRRILARLFTFKSGIGGTAAFDQMNARRAIEEWRHIVDLDPRNAEAWAFLSELHKRAGEPAEHTESLKRWISSSVPVESQFYRRMMGGESSLSADTASILLAAIYLSNNNITEAAGLLGPLVADDPGNSEAAELYRQALESASDDILLQAVDTLRTAVFASPENRMLSGLLVQASQRVGKGTETARQLEVLVERIVTRNRETAGVLQVQVGDLYAGDGRLADAVGSYEKALEYGGSGDDSPLADDESDMTIDVLERMIRATKYLGDPVDAERLIRRSVKILGEGHPFPQKQLIDLYREFGRRSEALAEVRKARAASPEDIGLRRIEANILTDLGRVDDAVALILANSRPPGNANRPDSAAITRSATPGRTDELSDLLFVSGLLTRAKRFDDALKAAREAFAIANGPELKQIAKAMLATAQHRSGDLSAAENTLREILRETPNNPIAMNNLGYFLLERDQRIEEARDLIRRALDIDPTNPNYLDSLGWAYYKLGDYATAERYLREAARIDGSSPAIEEHLGDVYEKLDRKEIALVHWRRALRLATADDDILRIRKKVGIVR
jgi:tetratricopeptide (TPR) repeat protein